MHSFLHLTLGMQYALWLLQRNSDVCHKHAAYTNIQLLNFDTMNIIGQRIKKLRDERGITQETMALQLDVTQSNYGRLEKDDRRLNVVKLLKIARILNVNINYLFSDVAAEGSDEEAVAFSSANKEVYDILVESLRAEVQHLKDEVSFLRVMVRS